MARESKFTFIPVNQLTSTDEHSILGRASINLEHKQMYFKKEYVISNSLEGKYIKFYLDIPKKTIAWKFFEKGSLDNLSEYRKISIQKTGSCVVSIAKVLKKLKLKEDVDYKNLEIKEYKDTSLLADNIFYYISLDKLKCE